MPSTLHATSPDVKLTWPVAHCPSCLADANGHFCATCGETLRPHLPSAGEFAHEFIGHYVALEGKLLTTLRLLLLHPGRLTIDFLNGRRVPTIAPLRLYLTLSLVMFAMIRWCGVELPQLRLNNDSLGVSYSHIVANSARPGQTGTATLFARLDEDRDDRSGTSLREDIRAAIDMLGTLKSAWARNVEQFIAEPAAEQGRTLNHGFLANLPYMLIAALPLFALYLKLLYRGKGRVYGEHLVFALHANAFAFLLASVMMAVPGNVAWLVMACFKHRMDLISAWDCVQVLPCVWLLAYLPVAMRRVYGGTRLATAAKWVALLGVHVLVIAMLTIAAELIAIVGHG